VQAALHARVATVPAGAWITAIGGWIPAQFAENRLPTLAELDAAVPNNPVLVFQQFTGPSATNTLGKAFFTSKGITVGATGGLDGTGSSIQALDELRAIQTLDDKKQGTLDAMAYSATMGVTTNVDMGGFVIPGLPNIEDSFTFDTSASWDPFSAYDSFLALHKEGRISVRLRIFFLSMDLNPDVPLTTQRALNAFPNFGDDMMRASGIGEFATVWPFLFGAARRTFPRRCRLSPSGGGHTNSTVSLPPRTAASSRPISRSTPPPRSPICTGLSRMCRRSRPPTSIWRSRWGSASPSILSNISRATPRQTPDRPFARS
jgi:hypothetical protein